jgi:hypothetical protein
MMALEAAALKVERAKQHINELGRLTEAFFSEGHGLRILSNPEATKRTLAVVSDKPIPPDFALIIGDAIHNLRSALDLATWEIISPLGPKNPNRVQFPFVKEADRLEGDLANREIKRASKKIVDAFRETKPYPRGMMISLASIDSILQTNINF